SHRPRNEPRFFGGKYPFIQTGDVVKAKGGSVGYKQTLNEEGLSVSKLFHPPLVLLTIAANIGDTAILDYDACFTDSVVGITPIDTNKIDTYFLQVLLSQKQEELNEVAAATQSAQKNLSVSKLSPITIHIPSISEQKIIMKGILLEQEIVNSNKKLIALYEQKIQKRIAQVWGEDE
ncbi:MAG: restriction endonuclease subunit S, partial [Flavobacteriales bacterium]|nr:restriction endonuclease subunit S [Flavobacteriales bacterium]